MSADPRIAWGITGAGHFLEPCVELLASHGQADVFFSAAGLEVVKLYKLYSLLKSSGRNLFFDGDAASFPITRLYGGRYDLVVIAPATSNTVAKMALGISDGLVTNLFANAGKCRIPTLVLPCDSKAGEVVSATHKGKEISVHVRPVDEGNAEAIARFEGVRVLESPEQLEEVLLAWPTSSTPL